MISYEERHEIEAVRLEIRALTFAVLALGTALAPASEELVRGLGKQLNEAMDSADAHAKSAATVPLE